MSFPVLIKKVSSSAAVLLVVLFLLGTINAAAAGHRTHNGCTVSDGQWVNLPLSSPQAGNFQISFSATPSSSSIDGVAGLSSGATNSFAKLAAIVRFNSSGNIDARNGSNYVAASAIPYSAGISYQFILSVNVPAHTYSAYVMIGGVQTTIGFNFAFRTEQAAVASLSELASMTSPGSESICNLTLTAQTGAPTITMQPVNQIVTAGQTATFAVAATGTAPLTYQWQKNGANISGATSNTYSTPSTATANGGSTFDVVVSNASGSKTSSSATLTVNAAAVAPSVTTQPASQTVTAGQAATFSVSCSGTSPMTYQWQKNGANIAGATSSSYTTAATATSDNNSKFDVIVSNVAGTVTSSSATLTVNTAAIAPSITSQPASQSVMVGRTATFTVAASGTAPMSYQWQKNKANIAGATSSSYTTSATTSSDNASTFDVVVTNSVNSVTSNSATLTVTAATLTLSANPASLGFGNVNLSTPSTKTVTITNTGNSSVTISNVMIAGAGFDGSGGNGVILSAGQTTSISATFDPSATGSATGSLTVSSNAANSPMTIALSGTGVAPVQHSVSLSWQASTSSVVGYNVYSTTSASGTMNKLTSSPVTPTDYVDDTVQANQTYYYVVTAVSTDGVESTDSNEVSALVP